MTKQYMEFSKNLQNTINLPTPSNISYNWNFGSLLITCLVAQILTGLILASKYSPSMSYSYLSTMLVTNTDYPMMMRFIHSNLGSLFFMLMYLHLIRGIFYKSYSLQNTWMSGVSILIISMATAFLGYSLPINQMSFWAASVITNLFSEIPYIGTHLIRFLWGGMSVNEPTMTRFYMLHYLLPFLILVLILLHIFFLHETGSNDPLAFSSSKSKQTFNPFLSMKDMVTISMTAMLFSTLCLLKYWLFMENDNFIVSNTSVTPIHIQPEWYFLFAYAILRSVPNKLGGVIALFLSVIILYTMPLSIKKINLKSSSISVKSMLLVSTFLITVILLTWIGMMSVEPPYIIIGQLLTSIYFSYFMINLFLPWKLTN